MMLRSTFSETQYAFCLCAQKWIMPLLLTGTQTRRTQCFYQDLSVKVKCIQEFPGQWKKQYKPTSPSLMSTNWSTGFQANQVNKFCPLNTICDLVRHVTLMKASTILCTFCFSSIILICYISGFGKSWGKNASQKKRLVPRSRTSQHY